MPKTTPVQYTIQFMPLKPLDDKHESLGITNKTLAPSNLNVPRNILELIDGLAFDYMTAYGQYIKDSAKARITLSLDKGITFDSCSDPRMEAAFKKGITAVGIPKSETSQGQLHFIKRVKPDKKMLEEAQTNCPGEEVIFFDPWAFSLLSAQANSPIQIDLELTKRLFGGKGKGCTTGPLRFPHLLKDLSSQIKPNAKICIVGPGLLEEENAMPSCPQFVEIYSLFPQADFLLLDNDPNALSVLRNQFHKCKFAAYDPTMLKSYTEKDRSDFRPNKSYQKIFASLKNAFAKSAILPKSAANMLMSDVPAERLVVKVNPEKIEVREFDINTSSLAKNEQFDVIISTMTIGNVIHDKIKETPECDRLSYLQKFLDNLKDHGSLYIDTHLVTSYFGSLEELIKSLELRMECPLKGREIPLSDFNPAQLSLVGTLDSMTISSLKKYKMDKNITSTSLMVITRLPKNTEAKND